jgi:hypothetical protein
MDDMLQCLRAVSGFKNITHFKKKKKKKASPPQETATKTT